MSAYTLTCTHKVWYASQALDQLSVRDGQQPVMHQQAADIFQKLATELDTEGRYLFLNALANQLRFPNNHTHYFSCILLYLFDQNEKVSHCSHDGLPEDISVTAWGALSCLQLCCQPTCLNPESVREDSGFDNLIGKPAAGLLKTGLSSSEKRLLVIATQGCKHRLHRAGSMLR